MVMKPKLYLICLFLAISLQTVNAQQADIDGLYNTLDSLIEHRSKLLAEKEIRLKALKDGLQKGLDDDQLFKLNERIYDEYMAYNFDSAYYYINKNVERQPCRPLCSQCRQNGSYPCGIRHLQQCQTAAERGPSGGHQYSKQNRLL